MKKVMSKCSFHLIWIFGLIEILTVPFVVAPFYIFKEETFKNPLHGIVIGFLSIIVLFSSLNIFIQKLDIKIAYHKIVAIFVFPSAIWNSLLLSLLFLVQNYIANVLNLKIIYNQIIFGFMSVFITVGLICFLYNFLSNKIPLCSIKIKTEKSILIINKLSVFSIAIFAGLYECIAYPIIHIWRYFHSHQILISVFSGAAGGIIGASIICIIYNYFHKPVLWIKIAEKTEK
ncbi:MAG: hypothetical protein HQ534_14635 [Armatimonadetes bacterium]|nr:hypothetical protein [Armatimonadota bacterium]